MGLVGTVGLGLAGWFAGVVYGSADSFDRPVPVGLLVGLAVVALVLDAVNGQVARRTGTVSAPPHARHRDDWRPWYGAVT